jgi:hypothetical protein
MYAQNTEKVALLSVFETLEIKHSIRFSYATNEVTNIKITPPSINYSLKESLTYLAENTPFLFTQIDERYITVVLKVQENIFCGKLIDVTSGFPLEGASVTTKNNSFSTLSNSEGIFFVSKINTSETINISYVGFETIQIPVSKLDNSCGSILMQPSISELSLVLLETYFTKGINKQLDGSFTINTDNFGLLPGQIDGDVLQIAQALPGVESIDETVSNINIRGGTHDENNILWDDIKMYQSGHFFGLISAFNPDLTKKVTVYKNGTNPRYGEGVSGVIDMRSENTISNSFSGGAGFNLINTHAFGQIPLSNSFEIQVSGRKAINNFLKSPIYSIYTDRIFQDTEITAIENNSSGAKVSSENTFDFYDFNAKLLWDLSEKSAFRINILTINNDLEFTEMVENASSSETSNLGQRSLVGGISWKQLWNNKLTTNALGYGSYYLLNSVNEEIFTTQKLTQENEVLETGIKLDAILKLSDKTELQGGYHFSETGIANTQDVNLPRFRSYEKNVLRSHIAFTNLQYTPNGSKTSINVGLRANYFTKFNKALIEPRLSVHQNLGKGFAVEALGEFKSQTTTQRIDFESDFLGIEKRRWVLTNNEDVPIIKSKQASVGILYNKLNWFINIEGFYKIVEGITTSNQGFQNQFQFTRSDGKYTAKGLEFVLNKKTKSFSFWGSYLLMKNDYNFSSLLPSNFSSNLDIRHTATLASTYKHNNLKLALGINWHSGKPYTLPLAGEEIILENNLQTIQYNTPNKERLPDYFRTNLSAEYLWNLSEKIDAKFNFAILNVFNTKNTLNIRYALDVDANGETQVNKIEEVSLGFTPNFSLQVLF